MAHVDNLIQARAQKIALSAVATLSRPHRIPPGQITSATRESQIEFARNPLAGSHFPANQILIAAQFPIQIQRLRKSSRTTEYFDLIVVILE
jgi:hypothetical protein